MALWKSVFPLYFPSCLPLTLSFHWREALLSFSYEGQNSLLEIQFTPQALHLHLSLGKFSGFIRDFQATALYPYKGQKDM